MKSIAWLLALILIVPAEARERTMEQAKKIPLGSEVVVTLKEKQAFTGRLVELNENSFTLRSFVPGEADRLVPFQE